VKSIDGQAHTITLAPRPKKFRLGRIVNPMTFAGQKTRSSSKSSAGLPEQSFARSSRMALLLFHRGGNSHFL
jgi:hypothetical protein